MGVAMGEVGVAMVESGCSGSDWGYSPSATNMQQQHGSPFSTPGLSHRVLVSASSGFSTPNHRSHRSLGTPTRQRSPRPQQRRSSSPLRPPCTTLRRRSCSPNPPGFSGILSSVNQQRRKSSGASPYRISSPASSPYHTGSPASPYSSPASPASRSTCSSRDFDSGDDPSTTWREPASSSGGSLEHERYDDYDVPGYTLPRGSHPVIPPECFVLDSLNINNGSDPLMQTARGKLQTQRSKLNDQINREIRLRAGAENLYKATTNKKLRETVALELSYVNSNLQLLKEELADLNSSVLIYQSDSAINCVPMLPLGLKETKEVDFKPIFKEYISSHYHEDGESYDLEIQALNDIRQACRTPVRNETGIQLLYEYYNHLYFVEKRFFPPDKSLGLYFEWYDSLTGVPSAQRTVGFEKGSTLFNIAALYTQIGARQDRTKLDGVDKAVDCFQRAAGTFQYLQDNFSHAPSMDLQPPTLTMLIQLMLSQAQECIMERSMLEKPPSNIHSYLQSAQEAAKVAEMYAISHGVMQEAGIKEYVPPSWVSMAEVKSQYFTSLAHHHTATAILDLKDGEVVELREKFEKVHISLNGTPSRMSSPHMAIETFSERKTLAKAHLRQSILCLEEAMGLHSHSKQLRRIDTFQDILRAAHDALLLLFANLEEEDDFSELASAPPIRPHSGYSVNSTQPDFGKYKVDDLMRRLGLLAIFSARHSWTAPREVVLHREAGQDYGFSVRGDSPVIVAMVEDDSLASRSGMKVGDFMVAVEHRDVKWSKHDEVVQLIRSAGPTLRLQVVSPIDRNYLEPSQPSHTTNSASSGTSNTSSSGQGASSSRSSDQEMGLKPTAKKEEKSGSAWTLRRKGGSKEKQSKAMSNGDR